MTQEPLKGKLNVWNLQDKEEWLYVKDIKSEVSGLIKFHEDRIEELIKIIEECDEYHNYKGLIDNDDYVIREIISGKLYEIQREYESIMAIEHWLEDVI